MAALVDQIRQLHSDLRFLVEKDPEQEVQGTTVLTLSAVLEEAQSSLPVDSTLGDQIFALISPESIEAREPIRVADLIEGPIKVKCLYGRDRLGIQWRCF